MGSSKRNLGLGEEQEGSGFEIVVDEWNRLNNHIVSSQTLGSFERRLDKFMDEDDRCNLAVFTQGLPQISLTVSCNFLTFVCSYIIKADFCFSEYFIAMPSHVKFQLYKFQHKFLKILIEVKLQVILKRKYFIGILRPLHLFRKC